jgi:hypothetical protein
MEKYNFSPDLNCSFREQYTTIFEPPPKKRAGEGNSSFLQGPADWPKLLGSTTKDQAQWDPTHTVPALQHLVIGWASS